MTNQIPATPVAPAAATPGSGAQGNNQPAGSTTVPASAPGKSDEGKVTITTEEYRRLQRSDARTRSFDRRKTFKPTTTNRGTNPVDVTISDPEAAQALAEEQTKRESAEQRALQAEVREKVRDLLGNEKYKNLPQSTKDLIVKNPHMLSTAETLDEAMYDIEDWLDEQAVTAQPIPTTTTPTTPITTTPSRETPPVVTPGSPAPVDAGALEDTSNLRGSARSQAALRNTFKKKGMPGMRQDS